jgi:hypothetical protein
LLRRKTAPVPERPRIRREWESSELSKTKRTSSDGAIEVSPAYARMDCAATLMARAVHLNQARLTEVPRQQPVLVATCWCATVARTAPVTRAEHAKERLGRRLRIRQLTHEVDDLRGATSASRKGNREGGSSYVGRDSTDGSRDCVRTDGRLLAPELCAISIERVSMSRGLPRKRQWLSTHLSLLNKTWQTRQAGPAERVHQVADLVLLPARLGAHPLLELNLPL